MVLVRLLLVQARPGSEAMMPTLMALLMMGLAQPRGPGLKVPGRHALGILRYDLLILVSCLGEGCFV